MTVAAATSMAAGHGVPIATETANARRRPPPPYALVAAPDGPEKALIYVSLVLKQGSSAQFRTIIADPPWPYDEAAA